HVTSPPDPYTLSLHDALPISVAAYAPPFSSVTRFPWGRSHPQLARHSADGKWLRRWPLHPGRHLNRLPLLGPRRTAPRPALVATAHRSIGYESRREETRVP